MKQETPLSLPNIYDQLSAFSSPTSLGGLVLLGPELKFSASDGHQRAALSITVRGSLAHATAMSSVALVAGTWDTTQQIVASSVVMVEKAEILLLDF